MTPHPSNAPLEQPEVSSDTPADTVVATVTVHDLQVTLYDQDTPLLMTRHIWWWSPRTKRNFAVGSHVFLTGLKDKVTFTFGRNTTGHASKGHRTYSCRA